MRNQISLNKNEVKRYAKVAVHIERSAQVDEHFGNVHLEKSDVSWKTMLDELAKTKYWDGYIDLLKKQVVVHSRLLRVSFYMDMPEGYISYECESGEVYG